MSELVNYATNIALVGDNNRVVNIIWGMFYNTDEYERWGYAAAVPIGDLGVQIGDLYDDETGKFYNSEGEIIKMTAEILNEEIDALDEFIINALYEEIIENAEDELNAL